LNPPENLLGPLVRRDGEPTFDEPWQAQALGIADALVAAGVIAADAWAARLGAILRARAEAGAADDADTYYGAVLEALETLLTETGSAAASEVDRRQQQWRRAYLNTPHGKPVELAAGESLGLLDAEKR
jgi:nitrile hydratase accessory protein